MDLPCLFTLPAACLRKSCCFEHVKVSRTGVGQKRSRDRDTDDSELDASEPPAKKQATVPEAVDEAISTHVEPTTSESRDEAVTESTEAPQRPDCIN